MGLVTATAAAALLAAACAAEPGMSPGDGAVVPPSTTTTSAAAELDGFALPDITARPIADADLLAMLPTGTGGMAASDNVSTRLMSNADLLTLATLDPTDEASDVVRFGRINGAAGAYPQEGGATAYVWIDALSDSDAAHGYLLDYAGDVFKGTGGTHAPDAAAIEVAEFPIEVGEEAIGLDLANGSGRETAVVFRLGRIVVWSSLARPDDADSRVALQYLAEEVADRVVSTLTTGIPAPPRPDTPDHRFETTTSIDAGGTRYTVEVTGVVTDAEVACSLHLVTPAGDHRGDLVLVDGILWSRQGSGDPRLVAGNLAQRALFARCPSWPLDARDAGLLGLAAEHPTSHPVNGLDAWGYRSDLNGLEQVLGGPLGNATVDAFSFWVAAEGVPWLLELSVIAHGDAAGLEALTGPGFEELGEITVTVRHRVLDLGGPVDPALS